MPHYTVRIRLQEPTWEEIKLIRTQMSEMLNSEPIFFDASGQASKVNEWLCFDTHRDSLFTAHQLVRDAVTATGKSGQFTIMRKKKSDTHRYSLDHQSSQN